MPTESDAAETDLITAARGGSLDAFNALVIRHQDAVYALCRRLLGIPQAAEDATQETFLSAFRAIGKFAGGNLRNWLLRIAANQCKDELRRRRRRPLPPQPFPGSSDPAFDPPDESADVAAALENAELGRRLEAALLAIAFDQRQAIVLADIHGYHYDEIASIAGCSVGTVKSRIARGRQRLRAILEADPELFPLADRLTSRDESPP